VKNFTLWGFTDAHSWIPFFWSNQGIPKDDALIFTRDYQPKPAYDTLLYVLKTAVLTSEKPTLEVPELTILGNPSHSEFYIIKPGLDDTAEPIRVVNAMGQEMYRGEIERSLVLGNNWPTGLYLLTHKNKSYRLVKR
jgi:hypothetical protein